MPCARQAVLPGANTNFCFLYWERVRAERALQLRPAEEPLVTDAAAVRDRFVFPAVYTLPDESKDRPLWYVLPEELTRPCGRQRPQPLAGRPIETNFTRRPGKSDAGFVFDAAGRRVAPDAILSPRTRLFAPAGVWVSGPLDSQIYRCVWDAVELGFADLSAGCMAKVRTQTADDDTFDPAGWHDGFAAVGTSDGPGVGRDRTIDFLVTSPPGRYLWLEVSFQGDGFATPVLRGMTVRFPRRSYLEHLPAVFSEDEQGRDFLERFLAIFQSSWDPFERQAQSLAGLLDPRAVQASHLGYLAGWLGQTFASGWPEEERRRLLAALPGIRFARRADGEQRPGGSRSGTPAALREYLAAVLPVIAGRAVPPAFPLLIEGFRERDYRLLPAVGEDDVERDALAGAEEEPVAPLWGASRVGRFRLGESSLLEVGRLVPEGSPELDVFAAHAHRFRVVVPAPLVATANAEAALRRAIDREKPAHTVCDLQLVGGRFRVGVQSTVGIDTLLGSLPAARLAPSGGEPTAAPSGPPQSRLGYDTILWPRGSPAGVRLGAGVSLGTEGVRL